MDPGSTTVTIFGQEYTVRGGDDPEYVRRIAAFVDERMRLVSNSSSQITSMRVAILAALNIADELFEERQGRESLLRPYKEQAARLARSLEESCG